MTFQLNSAAMSETVFIFISFQIMENILESLHKPNYVIDQRRN